jgi:predicted Zn-dependent protease
MAEFYLMTGDLNAAYNQLQMALTTQGLDPIQRARISARLEQVHQAMPKTRKVADDTRGGQR